MRYLWLLVISGASFVACERGVESPQQHPSASVARPADAGVVHAETSPKDPVCPPSAPDFGSQLIEAAKAIRPSLVSITSNNAANRGEQETTLDDTPLEFLLKGVPMTRHQSERRREIGSGVIIDSAGKILTTHHLVEGADTVKVILFDGREVIARVVGADPRTDLAVIQVTKEPQRLQPAAMGDSETLEVGEWVLSCGCPIGTRQSVSAGIISDVGRGSAGIADYEDYIQTDAAINASNAGGALVDRKGRLIGINTAVAAQKTGSGDGVGLVIPINMARKIMMQLINQGKMLRGDVGLYVSNLNDELARSFAFRKSGGALVQDVRPDAPAARAGIEPGDIIVQCNGHDVSNATDFRTAISNLAPGTKTEIAAFRNGKIVKYQVDVAEAPAAVNKTDPAAVRDPLRWGLELAEITPELQQRLGLSSAQGAVIVKVNPNSAADDAGLRAGDLLESVGDTPVRDAEHAQRLMLLAKLPARLRIVHDGRGSFVIVGAE